ncbi:MAG: tripartite tricarboxylate transporter substrate binding protein [Burkholderiales bacterium]|nr:tripartite tricarboxylate transporter substrate binding protein [Burkholderiales bacterium]
MALVPARGAALACGMFVALASAAALAQPAAPAGWPAKPIRLIVPFPGGASSDIVGRMLVQKMAGELGQQVVVDNRAGVGGNLGIGVAAKAPPDGYTMVIATASIAVSASLYANPGYDAVRDLAPVARLTSIPNVLLVHPSVPARTLRQFVELARAHPGRLNFGSGGAGTTNHLANELLKHLERIDLVHVPFKGVTQAMTAMMSGEVDNVVMPVTTALPQVRAGRVRALAVLTEKRVAVLPEVPTSMEAGVTGFTMPLWYGMFAPAATPLEIVARLNAGLVKALQAPDVRDRLIAMGVDPWPGSAGELAELLRADIQRYGVVVRAAGLPRQ